MRGLKRISALILFLLVGGQFMLLPVQVYAWCCGFCQCSGGCDCYDPVTGACPMAGPCRSSDKSWAKSPANTDTLSSSSPHLIVLVSTSAPAERLTDLARGGECARKQFTRTLLSSLGDGLKFEPGYFDEPNIQDTAVFTATAWRLAEHEIQK